MLSTSSNAKNEFFTVDGLKIRNVERGAVKFTYGEVIYVVSAADAVNLTPTT